MWVDQCTLFCELHCVVLHRVFIKPCFESADGWLFWAIDSRMRLAGDGFSEFMWNVFPVWVSSVREWKKTHESLLNGCCSSASYLKNISFFMTFWQCRNIFIVWEILYCAWYWIELFLWSKGWKGNVCVYIYIVCYLSKQNNLESNLWEWCFKHFSCFAFIHTLNYAGLKSLNSQTKTLKVLNHKIHSHGFKCGISGKKWLYSSVFLSSFKIEHP